LGTCEPRILNTSIVGEIIVELKIASNDILLSSAIVGAHTSAETIDPFKEPTAQPMEIGDTVAGAATAGNNVKPIDAFFQLDNCYMTVRTLDLNPSYYTSLRSELEGGTVNIPFTNVTLTPGNLTAPGSIASTSRCVANSGNVNMLLTTLVPSDAGSQTVQFNASAIPTTPYSSSNVQLPTATFGNTQTTRLYQRGFVDVTKPFSSSIFVNNVAVDHVKNIVDVWNDLEDGFGFARDPARGLNPRLNNIYDFGAAYFATICKLDLQTDEIAANTTRQLSGLDSRQSSVQFLSTLTGSTLNSNIAVTPMMYVFSTSILQIAAGRQISILQ
jgi:hypothetical protein